MSGARQGFVGPLPSRTGVHDGGLDADLLTLWDRWWELTSAQGVPSWLDPNRPAWRLMARAGLFAPEPVAGVFRLGVDRKGRIYPFAVLRSGAAPDPQDPWYDEAARLAVSATEGELDLSGVIRRLQELSPPRILSTTPEAAAVLWRDDWEVREVVASSGADLVHFPLRAAAESGLEDLT